MFRFCPFESVSDKDKQYLINYHNLSWHIKQWLDNEVPKSEVDIA